MTMRFAPVAGAVAAIMLLGACGDDDDSSTTTSESSTTTTEALDGATTLATGGVVELADGQTLNVSAEAEDGEVTGEIRLSDPDGEVVVTVECEDTDTDGVVILGGTITEADDDVSGLVALFIKEGDPDSVAVWYDEGENPSCGDLLRNRHDVLEDPGAFVDVEAGSDIESA
jgi:major membrane immunogen (membrane-anchored lipoprotein)